MTSHEEAWWTDFRDGHIGIQKCTDCGITQFPPGNICRNCQVENSLKNLRLSSAEMYLRAKTVVRTAVSAAMENSIPYVLATLSTPSGARFTFPICRVIPTTRLEAGAQGKYLSEKLHEIRSTREILAVEPCDCSTIDLPHVKATRKAAYQ